MVASHALHGQSLPLGFAGGLFDPDTGLTRFVWRDYDAETGRFTALDPLREKGGDTDWYGYCVDDPVNRVDVCGLFSWGDILTKIPSLGSKALPALLKGAGKIIKAPLNDMLFPDSLNDVPQEQPEFWEKWGKPTEPEDLRDRH